MSFLSRVCMLGLCLLSWLAIGGRSAVAAPHTLAELAAETTIRDVSISPDGKYVAVVAKPIDEKDAVINIMSVDKLGTGTSFDKVSLGLKEKLNIDWARWATPERLLAGVTVTSQGVKDPDAAVKFDQAGFLVQRRVVAVNKDGSKPVVLFQNAKGFMRRQTNLNYVLSSVPGRENLVVMPAHDTSRLNLYHVDIYTGISTLIAKGTPTTIGWDAEDGAAALRYDMWTARSVRVYGRKDKAKDDWDLIIKYRLGDDDEDRDWIYAGDAPGPGTFYVLTRGDERDTMAIRPFDVVTKTLGPAIAEHAQFDMREAFTVGGRYAGASYLADTLTYQLVDPQLQRHWRGLHKYFQGAANVYIVGSDRDQKILLLFVNGPRAPGDYYVYDAAKASLKLIVSANGLLDPERLAEIEVLKIPTRDGASIAAYLTRPNNKAAGPQPMVVMPHGGPRARDHVTFDVVAQAFASQGWLVLQPNFRGSAGYGTKFMTAGNRQWSGLMQDDVTDAVRELIKRGVADPKRTVIYGASYGGYAALAGTYLTPEYYRGAASFAGVTDLLELLKYERTQRSDQEEYQEVVDIIGDPKTEAARLRQTSPVHRAAEINVPILLVHGARDRRVPIEQAREMEGALKAAGKQVRLVEYPYEGHGLESSANVLKHLTDLIDFFKPILNPAPK